MKEEKNAVKQLSRSNIYYIMCNIKGIMMFFIVMFHCISPVVNQSRFSYANDSPLPTMILTVLVALLMFSAVPSFVFMTGYSSKDTESCRKDAFGLYLLPYFVLTLLLALEYSIINGVFYVDVFEPLMQLWFLMAMYIWMITLNDVVSIRFVLPLSIALCLATGMVANGTLFKFTFGVTSFFALSYVFMFFPFMLIGLKTTDSVLCRIRNTRILPVIFSFLLIITISVGLGCVFYFDDKRRLFDLAVLKGSGNYLEYLGGDSGFSTYSEVNIYGAFLRILLFVFVFALMCLLIRFIPKNRVPFLTRVGEASMTIFCLHIFILVPLTRLIKPDLWLQLLISVPLSVVLCFVLSMKNVNRGFMRIIFKMSDAVCVKKH